MIHKYKGYEIENVPLKGEARWFISKDGMQVYKYALETLRESKQIVDTILIKGKIL